MIASRTRLSAASRAAPFKAVAPRVSSRTVVAQSAVSEVVEKLKTMTLLEAAELVKEIEETFGVDASAAAPVAMMAAPGAAGAGGAAAEEEKTTFDLVLEDFDAGKKVGVYKAVRNICGIAVNQVKEYTASLPKVLLEGMSKEDAEKALEELTAAGGKGKVA
mmetsp:Transcript_52343/g.114172  ORF Transcript_52343/g.114172 Transcript_52343/m.114172 type:complete len:162 (+) Transcript_52343:1346-1831(+)